MSERDDIVSRLRWPGIHGSVDHPVSVKLRVEAADEIERLRASPAIGATREWQPIETAPRDIDVLMAWWVDYDRRWKIESGLAGSTRGGWLHGRASHWMPLPTAPHTRPERSHQATAAQEGE